MKDRFQQQKYDGESSGPMNDNQNFTSHSPTPQRHSGKQSRDKQAVMPNVKMQIAKKPGNSKVNSNAMFMHPQRDSSQDIHDKFDMLAQFYQPANQTQATFDNMYDNINLENIVMTSNKQNAEKQADGGQGESQGNHQQASSKGGNNKYSSPKTSKYGF